MYKLLGVIYLVLLSICDLSTCVPWQGIFRTPFGVDSGAKQGQVLCFDLGPFLLPLDQDRGVALWRRGCAHLSVLDYTAGLRPHPQ